MGFLDLPSFILNLVSSVNIQETIEKTLRRNSWAQRDLVSSKVMAEEQDSSLLGICGGEGVMFCRCLTSSGNWETLVFPGG